MKALHPLVMAGLLGLLTSATFGQISPGTTPTITDADRVGRVLTPDAPKGNLDPVDATSVRPTLAERNQVSPEVLEKMRIFRLEADKYMRQQQELRKRLLGVATDAERDRIREQIRMAREKWLERARTLREEYRDRQVELMEKLPSRREMLREAAQEKAQTLRDGAAERKRRAIDR